MTGNADTPKPENEVSDEKKDGDFYDRVRRRIVEEDNIINHRMMWGTLAQTALFAGFGVANLEKFEGLRKAVSLGIGFSGLLVAVLLILSVWAARREISVLEKLYKEKTGTGGPYKPIALPVMATRNRHLTGHTLAILLPVVTGGLWLWVLFNTLY